ncbi:MAG: PKD domain-containing protein [Bdellovibrionaceae bacterium]|nr:PKD domain-containing protein [Pseudobdellovibrionaceae bacterium]
MIQFKNMVAMGVASVVLAGCQKGAQDATSSASVDVLAQAACSPTAPELDAATVGILGKITVGVGQDTSYKLNQAVNCKDAELMTWTAGASASQDGARLNWNFEQPGTYIVSAEVPVSAGSAAKLSSTKSATRILTATKSESDTAAEAMAVTTLKTTVVGTSAAIVGPQVAIAGEFVTYDSGIPSGKTLQSASWNFGDGSPVVSSVNSVLHIFSMPGTFDVQLSLTYADGSTESVRQTVVSVAGIDGLECVTDLTISGPSAGQAGQALVFSAYLPPCLDPAVTDVKWTMGESSTSISGRTVSYTYSAAGTFTVSMRIFTAASATVPWVTLTRTIDVSPAPVPSPTPAPSPEPSPEPSPVPSPTPAPVDPKSCSTAGLTRTSYGAPSSSREMCGLDGTKLVTSRERIVEECRDIQETLLWTETSRTRETLSQSDCEGQSCRMTDGSVIRDGGSQTGVVVGEIKTPVACEFGETGIYNTYSQVADFSCANGVLTSSTTRQGSQTVAGVCPTYSWVDTETWTTCSAACGGTQTQVMVCRDAMGNEAPSDRCKVPAPAMSRVCDGDPDSVKRTDRETTREEGGSTNVCPKNQIGVTVSHRDVTTVKNYACIDHSVQLASESKEYTEWQTESYCRDYVPHRCSQDSLSITQARARHDWMQKCRATVPAIDEFLKNFEDVQVGTGKNAFSLDSARPMYATFMNRATTPEKAWIAPKVASASCTVPSTAYVAAVCVSSCATPEQRILAGTSTEGMKPVKFIDALVAKTASVATLGADGTMNSRRVEATPVENWVTELVDTEHTILNFKMASGRVLRITPNHPVLADDGSMRLASDFKVGDNLVRIGGKRDPIVAIESTKHIGKVYNLFLNTSEPKRNIVVTEGYLNGTAFFQNEGSDQLNRQLLQKKLTRGVFAK